ncbi:SDR family NAD(P)-dependent oxidoreductase [Hyphomicrobium sp. 1Nfss2.1]|uniref:SDR family NAD(P)-dependent oxidoreductase n=1 Tax=Hyphomicrobium sp. 1Nfss2.1 TaxID=3413936 RepID=UPI003C7B23B1
MKNNKPLKDRLALVTGASRGIGRAVALGLAKAGAHVVVVARTVGALEELDDEIRAAGGSATLLQLDISKGDKVDQIGPTLFQRWGKLDILVANAGILGPLSPLPHVTEDAWKQVIDINLSANWRLIRTLDPLLKRSDAGRAVFVTSGAATGKYAYWGPYAVSKAGLECLVKTYAHELETTNVRVNLLNPGPVRTGMRAKAFPGEDPNKLPSPEELVPLFLELVSPACDFSAQVVNFADWKKHHADA